MGVSAPPSSSSLLLGERGEEVAVSAPPPSSSSLFLGETGGRWPSAPPPSSSSLLLGERGGEVAVSAPPVQQLRFQNRLVNCALVHCL